VKEIAMSRAPFRPTIATAALAALLAAHCAVAAAAAPPAALVPVARSEKLWTGVAVTKEGRIFVNYPRWSSSVEVSVAEITRSGEVVPFPPGEWNRWEPAAPPEGRFVCVQSVHVDRDGSLWVLDPASLGAGGVVEGGAKLLKVDLGSNQVVRTIRFAAAVAPPASYLNDVRIDTARGFAYITDSGLGALVVVNLGTGESRRLLDGHPSTKAEEITLQIEGTPWVRPDGSSPRIHADGIALDPKGEHLYYQALTGRTLYRISTALLRDPAAREADLAAGVEVVGSPEPADGIEFGLDGSLYLTSIEQNAIRRLAPGGGIEVVVQDPRLKWPDSLSIAPDGAIYVTTSQIHLGHARTEPYQIFAIRPPGGGR